MNPERQDRQNFTSTAYIVDYAAGNLRSILHDFQYREMTGVAGIEIPSENGFFKRIIVLRRGLIVYAGRTIPTPCEFVSELANHTHIGTLDTVLGFAAKRTSVQNVLQSMVGIGVLQWPTIAAAMRKQAEEVLMELLPLAGRISFKAGSSAFDLHYEKGAKGFEIDSLVAEGASALQQKPPGNSVNRSPNEEKLVILSVDDSPIAQALVKRTLGRDHTVIACNSAISALDTLNCRDDISGILLDLTMEEMDGLELCRMLRKIEKYQNLPIVILTARSGMVNKLRGRMAGATNYLTKPVRPTELLAAVTQHFRKSI